MKYIQHRVNTLSELRNLDLALGAEIDLRSDLSHPSSVHLSHDAWKRGDSFTDWLSLFKERNIKGTIIFNTKEDGLEEEVFRLAKSHDIENFFFLDTAFPTLIKYVHENRSEKFCCRLSKYEPADTLEPFIGKISWVWADCFNGQPLPLETFKKVKQNFKICLVSPELQKMPLEQINEFKNIVPELESVCTKRPDLWL